MGSACSWARTRLREVSHSGSTAGYSAFLTRFPDQRVSVAVLCNASNAQATQYAHAVADLYLGARLKPSEPRATHTLTSAEIAAFAGLWKGGDRAVTIARDKGGLVLAGTVPLFAQSAIRVVTGEQGEFQLDARGIRYTDPFGTVEELSREKAWMPAAGDLEPLAGAYVSDEAEATLTAAVPDGKLVLTRRPDTTIKLTPLYVNAFSAGSLGTVIFRREAGRPTEFSVVEDRVWDLRFKKIK
jgi:hypothetical protein